MVALAEAIKPQPASLANYHRMKEPCGQTQLEVQQDKTLSRFALFKQVQVRMPHQLGQCQADELQCSTAVHSWGDHLLRLTLHGDGHGSSDPPACFEPSFHAVACQIGCGFKLHR